MDGSAIGIRFAANAPLPNVAVAYRMEPQDFVVIEIDTDGVLVGGEGYTHPAETTTAAAAAAAAAIAPSNENATSDVAAPTAIVEKPKKLTFRECCGEELFMSLQRSVDEFRRRLMSSSVSLADCSSTVIASIDLSVHPQCRQLLVAPREQAASSSAAAVMPSYQLLPWVRSAVANELSPIVTITFIDDDDDDEQRQQQRLVCTLNDGVKTLAAATSSASLASAVTNRELLHNINNGSTAPITLTFAPNSTKDHRRAVHELLDCFSATFRKNMRGTDTIDMTPIHRNNNNNKQNESKAKRRQRDDRNDDVVGSSASNPAGFLYLVMDKVDVAAFTARKLVAESLRVPINSVQVSGTKDRRAVTTQRISVPAEKYVLDIFTNQTKIHNVFRSVHGATLSLRLPSSTVRRVPISLSTHHSGNYFRVKIQLSNVNCSSCNNNNSSSGQFLKEVLMKELRVRMDAMTSAAAADDASASGLYFANYFGPQRFGVSQIGNSNSNNSASSTILGVLIAAGRYEDAVRSMFNSGSQENVDQLSKARSMIWPSADGSNANSSSSNATVSTIDAALKLLPSSATACTDVLKNLRHCSKNNGGGEPGLNWKGALMLMSREERQIWVHSAQSLIFNEMLSEILLGSAAAAIPSSSSSLPLLGRKSFDENTVDPTALKLRGICCDILRRRFGMQQQQQDPIAAFCDEMETMLGSPLPGSSRICKALARNVALNLVNGAVEQESNKFSVELSCELPSGSFLSVLVRELFGVFPTEPNM